MRPRRKRAHPVALEPYQEPWQFKAYRENEKLIREVWELHSQMHIGGQFGTGSLGNTFWCVGCNSQWPCKTARMVMDHGSLTTGEIKPLKLERVPPSPSGSALKEGNPQQ
jgi:hypothetical protein